MFSSTTWFCCISCSFQHDIRFQHEDSARGVCRLTQTIVTLTKLVTPQTIHQCLKFIYSGSFDFNYSNLKVCFTYTTHYPCRNLVFAEAIRIDLISIWEFSQLTNLCRAQNCLFVHSKSRKYPNEKYVTKYSSRSITSHISVWVTQIGYEVHTMN